MTEKRSIDFGIIRNKIVYFGRIFFLYGLKQLHLYMWYGVLVFIWERILLALCTVSAKHYWEVWFAKIHRTKCLQCKPNWIFHKPTQKTSSTIVNTPNIQHIRGFRVVFFIIGGAYNIWMYCIHKNKLLYQNCIYSYELCFGCLILYYVVLISFSWNVLLLRFHWTSKTQIVKLTLVTRLAFVQSDFGFFSQHILSHIWISNWPIFSSCLHS